LHDDRTIIARLRENILPPRTMLTVAKEMATLYKNLPSHGAMDEFNATAAQVG